MFSKHRENRNLSPSDIVFIVIPLSLFLDSWDCVATCFFIDTAHNVIEYVERIWKILKPGGVWINLGESIYVRELHLNSARKQSF